MMANIFECWGVIYGFALANHASGPVLQAVAALKPMGRDTMTGTLSVDADIKPASSKANHLLEKEAERVEAARAQEAQAEPQPTKLRRPRKPMSEEYKQELRDRLARAREKKAKLINGKTHADSSKKN